MRIYNWRGSTWLFSDEDAKRLGLTNEDVANAKAAVPAATKQAKPAQNKGA